MSRLRFALATTIALFLLAAVYAYTRQNSANLMTVPSSSDDLALRSARHWYSRCVEISQSTHQPMDEIERLRSGVFALSRVPSVDPRVLAARRSVNECLRGLLAPEMTIH